MRVASLLALLITCCRDYELPSDHSAGGSGGAKNNPGGSSGGNGTTGGLSSSTGGQVQSGGRSGSGGTSGVAGGASGASTGGALRGGASNGGGAGGRGAMAGDGGTIDHAGDAGDGGVTSGGAAGGGAAGDGGATGGGGGQAGASGDGGSGGTIEPEPACEHGQTFDPQQPFSALAASRGPDGTMRVYAALPGSNRLAMSSQLEADGPLWSPWECFGAVSQPERLAATELSDGSALVLASTRTGGLLTRRGSGNIETFSSWSSLDLPSPTSLVQDVAATRGAEQRNYLYVVDRGRVFYRSTSSAEAASAYTAWSDLGVSDVRRLAATVLPSLAQIVILLGTDGTLGYAYQNAPTAGAPFSAVKPFPLAAPANTIDLECAQQRDQGVMAWVLDAQGQVRATSLPIDDSPSSSAWEPWIALSDRPFYLERASSLAALSASEITHYRTLFTASELGQAAYWLDFAWQYFAIAE